jgi:thioredoxin
MAHMTDRILLVHSDAQFAKQIKDAGSRLVIVDFFAVWCGPCKMIAPLYAQLSVKYPTALFLKVDVDQLRETAAKCGIRAMPTFQFYKHGELVEELVGADPVKMEALIQKHLTGTSGERGTFFPGEGHKLGRASTTPSTPSSLTSSPPQSVSTIPSAAPTLPSGTIPVHNTSNSSTQLSIRLSDGTLLRATFQRSDPLRVVYEYVKQHSNDGRSPFELVLTYPRAVHYFLCLYLSLRLCFIPVAFCFQGIWRTTSRNVTGAIGSAQHHSHLSQEINENVYRLQPQRHEANIFYFKFS